MAKASPTSSTSKEPSSRKRRAASLTAEALWNIQMEDDGGGKHGQSSKTVNYLEVTKNTSVNRQTTDTDNDIPKLTRRGRKKALKTAPSKDESKSCFHLPQQTLSKKISGARSGKAKPTASVVPLVMSETKPSSSSEERQLSDSGNSQVLLLPISLNHSGRATVPLLALSQVSVDLMKCFNAPGLMSPIVNMAPVLTTSANFFQRGTGDHHSRNLRYSTNHNLSGAIRESGTGIADQTEPLNLKLGESSIPSGTVHRIQRAGKKLTENHLTSPVALWKRRNSSVLTSDSKHGIAVLEKKFQSRFDNRATGWTIKNTSWHDAYSPSSESSGSGDTDESSGQKTQINLRCKAAPPPGRVGRLNLERKRTLSANGDNNGWTWDGQPYNGLVYSVEVARPVVRRCYPSMRRKSEPTSPSDDNDDDVVMVRDCVIMRADAGEQPYVAKVAALWQQPGTGKMMISLLWFYRPEHTADSRVLNTRYNEDELFASRHLDEISVACVEDKCFVLTYNQYCRYTAALEKAEDHIGAINGRDSVPQLPPVSGKPLTKYHQDLSTNTDKSLVYFCRKLYDIKSHRLLKTFPPPTALFYANSSNENF